MSWNIELVISDLNKTKRRIILSPNNNKLQIKPFFLKSPNVNYKQNIWINFTIDLYSFMQAFKGQTYRCLDNITIMGNFKLRRIYTTNTIPNYQENQHNQSFKSINLLPKNLLFPPEIQQVNLLNKFNPDNSSQVYLYEPTEPSTKNNSSYLKSTNKNKIPTSKVSSSKVQTVKSQKIVQINQNKINVNSYNKIHPKQFLANTNGPQMLNRLRKRQNYNQSSDSQSHITDNLNTPSSTQKSQIKQKRKLIKTQLMPPKNIRTSVQKRQKSKIEQKQKIKSKLNPWRTNVRRSQSTKMNQKNESDLQSSPNTTLFKSNNKFNESNNKGFDRKSDHYSESEYIELSQKFSTVTDGKFFNNRSNALNNENSRMAPNNIQNQKQYDNQDQIQQNIQMETNSIYSNSNKKPQYTPHKQQIINQSICDSLDRRSPQKDFQVIGRQSYYGLAERLMQNYMQQKSRPFSPPLHQRQHTEQDQSPMFNRNVQNDQKQVQLVYDPVLNCYYDHKTHTYYELKNLPN